MKKAIVLRALHLLNSRTSRCFPKLPLDSRSLINKLARAKAEIKTFSENKKGTFFKKSRKARSMGKTAFITCH